MVTEPQTIEGFALSDQQEHLWLLQAGHDAAYHAQGLYLLEGNLDTDLLQRALEQVLSRHEILRTRFRWLEGMDLPLQVIAPDMRVRIEHVDLSGLADDAQQAQTDALYERVRNSSLWNADQLPLQTHLITLGCRRHLLLVRLPALCADASTLRNLMHEIRRCYAACAGEALESEASLQYVDYTQWQQEVTAAEGAHVGLKYWQQDWSGDRSSELPFTRVQGGEPRSFEPASLCIDLDLEAVRSIQEQAQEDVSVREVLFSSWLVLLWRLMGGEGLTVAAACDGRDYSELESAIGLYERYLPIRLSLMGEQSMADVVRVARLGLLEAYRFQDYFSWKALGESASGSRQAPCVGFAFAYEVEASPERITGDLAISLPRRCVVSDRFAVRLSCIERGEVVRGELHYDRCRVSESDAKRVGKALGALLSSAAADAHAGIGTLNLLSCEERNELLVEWNDTAVEYRGDRYIHELFEAAVHAHSDTTALVFEEQHLTFDQLNRRANQLAHYLQTLGVGPEVRVGLCLQRSVDLIVGLLGILKAGGAYVPLDPALPQERLNWMLNDSGAKVLLTHEAFAERAEASVMCVCVDRDAHLFDPHSQHNPRCAVQAHHLVYVIYTSGSTGRPKGVGVEHRQLLNYVLGVSERLGLKSGASYASVSTLAADLGNTMVFPSLCLGGCLHLISSERGMDGAAFGEYLSSHRIDYLKIVPSHLWALLGEGAEARHRLPRAGLVLGGEASSWELVGRIREASAGLRVFNHYGPTETTVGVMTYAVELGASSQTTGSLTLPVGRALPNSRVYVLNGYLEPVPVGVCGELYIGGAGVCRGYLNRPDLTAEKFVPDPFSAVPGTRLYRTGDQVRWRADGNVEFVGRLDEQVKVRGFRIELGEIQSVLLQHGGVREAVVVAREEAGGEKRLVAYVAGHAGSVSVSELRAYLGEKLPEYMIPSAWVMLEQLPLTTNGKVDRKALPAPESPGQDEGYVAARTPIEEGVAEIWREVLRLEQVGVHTSFFALGGHSLLATQVISRIRNTFRVELPLRALFEAPTIAGMAERIGASGGEAGSGVPALARVSREGHLPLSFAQQRLWFIDQLEPGSSVYNIPMARRLTGSLDVGALQQSLHEIVLRHEALRTTFDVAEGDPFQVIQEGVAVALPVIDLSSLAGEEREREARHLITEEAQRPFDLSVGPMFRFGVLKMGAKEHILLITLHHIISDGWSQGVLRRELSTLYNAFSSGAMSPLPALPIQYADYAAWQREWLQGEELQRQLSYWKERLEGAPTLLELPTDRPRPPIQTFRGALARREFSSELTAGLKALGQREGMTLFMTLLAAFQTLLCRYTHQDVIVVGAPIANRTRSEVEGLIGFFINTLAMSTDLSGDPSFTELLGRVRESTLGAYAHQDLPFEKLVEELQPQRSLSHSPVFQVMFTFQNAPGAGLGLEDLEIEGMGSEGVSAKFDLSLFLWEVSGKLGGVLEYNTDLFDADRIARMLGHLEVLLEGIVADPQQKVSRLPLLTEPERHQLLVEWRATEAEYPRDRCIHELFEAQVERSPDAVAVVCAEQQLTYAQLNARSNQLARYLRQLGVGPGVLVGLCLERSLEMVVGLLGILKAGAAYVPLDPHYPQERLAFMLSDARPYVLMTQSRLRGRLSRYPGSILCLDDEQMRLTDFSEDNLNSTTDPDSVAYVIYTSGTTGTPKGVLGLHCSAVNRFHWMWQSYAFDPTDVCCQKTSLSFVDSVWEIFGPLLQGVRSVIISDTDLIDITALVRVLSAYDVTRIVLVPSLLTAMIANHVDLHNLLPNLKFWVTSGEALTLQLCGDFQDRMPLSNLINLYGSSEVAADVTYYDATNHTLSSAVPIGRPIANTQVCVLDRNLEPVPIGVVGELYIGGAGVCRGYLNRPDLTAEKFVPDPFSAVPGTRLYRTGDQVRWRADGNVEFVGRLDEQVKVRGFRIELGEIQSVLLQHGGVREAVVVAREEAGGEKRLVAYVAGHAGSVSVSELRAYLGEKLPEYMIPSAWVMLEQLPLTTNGKVDRKALPAPESPGQDEGYVAARTPIEEGVAEIWREVLRLEQVGVHTSFFALGGHSLLATQVISRIRNTFRVELPLRALFEAPTIAGMAERIGASGGEAGSGVPALARVSREGHLPLSFAQQRLWFIDQLEPGSSVYNIPMARRLTGSLDVGALQQSLHEIVLRHEALRTTFDVAEGDPFQVIQEGVAVALPVIDLSSLAGEEREREARHLITEEAQRPFDLSVGPVFRFGLLRLQEEEHILLITLHHIASDGWSQGVLRRELSTLYNAFRQGQPSPLPALPIQYADYALWQRNWLQAEPLQRQLDYWKSQMADAPPLLLLPTDRPAPRVRTYRGERVRVLLAPEPSLRLRELGRQEQATQFMILLALLDVVLYRYTGQTDLVVGTDIANRNHADTERLIGFFLNHLVLRTDVSGNPTFRELVQRVREVCLGAYAHQDLPFEKLVEVLRPQRSSSHTPVFQVLLVMNAPAPAFSFDASLKVSEVNAGVVTSKYDIGVFVSEGGLGLSTSWVYQTELFDASTMRGMASDLEALVECVASAPDTPLSDLEVLLLDLARQRVSRECAARRTRPHAGDEEIVQTEPTEQTYGSDRDEGGREAYELSPQQRFVWARQQHRPAYNAQLTLHLGGAVDKAALSAALRGVWQRHEALRTLFPRVVGRKVPLQTLSRRPAPSWRSHDLSDLSAHEQPTRVEQLAQGERQAALDLEQGPLLQGLLIHLNTNSHVLLLTLPALCVDRRSLRNLAAELGVLYAQGTSELAGEEPLQYADYAQWQHDLLASEDAPAQAARRFWSQQIEAVRRSVSVGLGRGLAGRGVFSPAVLVVDLEAGLLTEVEALARQLDMSCGVVLETVWGVLLSRWTGRSSVRLGHGSEGRCYAELERGLGLFSKTLPLPLEVAWSSALRPLLYKVDIAVRAAEGWEEFCNPQSVDLEEELAYGFEYEEWSEGWVSSPISILDLQADTSSLAVCLGCRRMSGGLRLEWGYDAHRYSEAEIGELASCYGALLRSALESPHAPVGSLNLLSASEREQVLVEWNATGVEYPRDRCIHDLFEEQVQRTPEAVAVVYEEEQLTYAQLNRRANQLAHCLQSLGVGPEAVVGLCVERSVDLIVGVLGILKAGGAYVPLDPALPQERLRWMLHDSGAKVLVTQEVRVGVADASTQCVCLDRDAPLLSGHSTHNPPRVVQAQHLVYVIYTSGSTGRPKGVGVEHRHLLNYVLGVSARLGLTAGAGYASVSTLSADLGNTMVFPSLCVGGCLHLISSERAMDGAAFGEYMSSHGIDYLKIVPSHLRALLGEGEEVGDRLPGSVLVLGGESSSWELLGQIRASRPLLRVFNHYGPTETTVGVLTYALASGPSQGALGSLTVPVGRALPNSRVYVLNAYLQPVAVGVCGELYIGGSGVARGYVGRAALTAEKFVPDPFSHEPGSRLYRTGDLCRYLSDGSVEFVGRVDDQVKIRGFRIELGEIQSVLVQHPGIREAVVVAREDEPGEKRLVGYVVAHAGPLPVSELRANLGERLPEFMLPSAFVFLAALPRSANGKVDRNALPAPDTARPEVQSGYQPPHTPAQEVLAKIWQDVLRVAQVGIHDNFFEVGGDSILSIQIIARANAAGLHLTPRQVFQHQTIAGLASVAGSAVARPSEQGLVSGGVPLTPIQCRFFEQERAEAHHYNQARLLELAPGVTSDHVGAVVGALLSHHDALRLRFVRSEAGWQQSNAAQEEGAVFSCVDLSAVVLAEQRVALTEACSGLQASLDLSQGPVVRVAYFAMGGEKSARLLIAIHHLCVDGVSWGVLLADLQRGLEQVLRGEAIVLPAKTLSFQAWSQRLGAYARSAELEKELGYWQALAHRGKDPLPSEQTPGEAQGKLPVDFTQGENTVGSQRVVRVGLSVEETRALLQEVPGVYHTQINEVLLTALGQALSEWTGEREVWVDLEGHGREALFEEGDVSRTVGWFTSRFPVRMQWGTWAHVGEALKVVKETLRSIPHHGIGYGVLRYLSEEAQVRASMAAVACPPVSFNYQGHLDAVVGECGLFSLASEGSGASQSGRALRTHVLEVLGVVREGCLELRFVYSAQRHARATMEGVAGRYVECLRALIAHCASSEAGGYTPSDFPKSPLGQLGLDHLQRGLGWTRGSHIEDLYALSPMQAGMLFHTLYASKPGVYVEHWLYTLEGEVDPVAFAGAWEHLIERHGVFRTSFHWEGLEAGVQVVHPKAELALECHDWRELSAEEQRAALSALQEEDRALGIDLTRAPLMCLHLMRTGSERWQLLWAFHHLLLDRWSVSQVMSELRVVYAAICEGERIALPPVRAYADYIGWLQEQDEDRAQAYWRRTLAGISRPTVLPMDKSPGSVSGKSETAQLGVRLSEETSTSLHSLAREHHLTLSTLVEGAWALLLSRYSGEEEVLFGATVSGRPASLRGVEWMVGLFINSLPVRVKVAGSTCVMDWLQQLQEQLLELREYESSSLVGIQSWSEVPRGVPLFESLVVVENTPVAQSWKEAGSDGAAGGALRCRAVGGTSSVDFPLLLIAVPGRQIGLSLSYDVSRYEGEAIERLLGHLEGLLAGIVAEPQRQISQLPMLSEAERHQLLVEWNATAVEYAGDRCLHELFEEQVQRTPEANALVFKDQQLPYAQLNARANRLAHFLRTQGVGPDVLVGLHLQRSLGMVVGILAVLKAGGAYVPFDPSYPPERLAFMLEDANVSVLLTQASLEGSLPPTPVSGLAIELAETAALSYPEENPESGVSGEHLAYMIYTSGSTGQPKGALNTHRGIRNRLLWMQAEYGLDSSDRVLQKTPFSFDVSVWEFLWPLLSGACLVVARPEGHKDPSYLVEVIRSCGITTLHFVPSMLRVFVEAEGVEGCVSLRRVICSGEALPLDLTQRFFSRLSGVELHNLYGPTEAAVDVTSYACSAEELGPSVPIGRPIANTQIHLLDRYGGLVPVGVPGELYIGGVNVGRGYHNRAELSAEKFVVDPFVGDGVSRMYRTGDRCRYLADGNIEYLGRLDDQVKVRGFRIELGEIQSVLLQHPEVREAVVLAREDEPGYRRLVGYVVGQAGSASVSELRAYLGEKLPEYMLPSAWVMMEQLPLTANGKVDRKALPAPEWQGEEEGYVSARTPVEEGLAQIWREVLHIEQVGVHTSFFELGGHSLSAVRLVTEIHRVFGYRLPLRVLFQSATIASIAHELSPQSNTTCWANANTVTPLQPGSDRVPLFCVAAPEVNALGYVALGRHMKEQPLYVLQTQYRSPTDRPYTRDELRDLAAVNIRAMRDLLPEGPYCLGGMCEGAHIAFEMAHQLQQEGVQVSMLVSFDAWPEQNTRTRFGWWLTGVYRTVRTYRNDRSVGLGWAVRRTAAFTVRTLRARLLSLFRPAVPDSWEARYWPGRRFVAPQYEGRITVLRVRNQNLYRPRRRDLGWSSWATERTDVYDVFGDHNTLFHEPHVLEVAAILEREMNRIQSTNRS